MTEATMPIPKKKPLEIQEIKPAVADKTSFVVPTKVANIKNLKPSPTDLARADQASKRASIRTAVGTYEMQERKTKTSKTGVTLDFSISKIASKSMDATHNATNYIQYALGQKGYPVKVNSTVAVPQKVLEDIAKTGTIKQMVSDYNTPKKGDTLPTELHMQILSSEDVQLAIKNLKK